jgi:transposase
MMGTKLRVFAPIEALALDALVSAESFYRQLDRALDLSFVRDLVADCYAAGGRPSIDPVVFFKLQLVMFFEGIRSERQLLTVAADRLSVRWYLGYDLNEALPDHSSLTRIRDRYGIEIFRRFFEQIVTQCQAAGLVWGRELYIDATKVAANADLDSLMPRFAVEAHLEQVFTAGNELENDAEPSDRIVQLPLPLDQARRDAAATDANWLTRLGRPEREQASGSYQRTADLRASTTDPDATPMRTADGRTRLGYQDHYVVDGGRADHPRRARGAGRGPGEPASSGSALARTIPLAAPSTTDHR